MPFAVSKGYTGEYRGSFALSKEARYDPSQFATQKHAYPLMLAPGDPNVEPRAWYAKDLFPLYMGKSRFV